MSSGVFKEDIGNEEAAKLLSNEWEYVEAYIDEDFLDHDKYTTENWYIRGILGGKQLTYRYILVTAALAKATNPRVHYRALQKGSDLPGAYDARSVAHGVIVPFEKSHGERLGGSNEPYLNRPARYTDFDLSNRDRNREAQNRLYQLLEKSQQHSQGDGTYPSAFLRQVLKEWIQLPPTKIDFHPPPVQLSLDVTYEIISEFLTASGSGERLVAVSAAIFSSLSEISGGRVTVQVYPVNWSDRFSKTAGDLEFYCDGNLVKAAEVKDKPLTEGDIRHCSMKAKEWELTEYMILNGAGIVEGDEQEILDYVESQTEEGVNLYMLSVPEGYFPYLIYLGEEGRKLFLSKIGEYLNEIRASMDNKQIWERLIKKHS